MMPLEWKVKPFNWNSTYICTNFFNYKVFICKQLINIEMLRIIPERFKKTVIILFYHELNKYGNLLTLSTGSCTWHY